MDDNRVSYFHANQVWESPKGSLYRVLRVAVGGKATLAQGIDGGGRKIYRDWDAVCGWVLKKEAPTYTHKLSAMHSNAVRFGFDIKLTTNTGETAGFATVCLTDRTACLGINNPREAIPANRMPKTSCAGRAWKRTLLENASAFLATSCGIDPACIDIGRAKFFISKI